MKIKEMVAQMGLKVLNQGTHSDTEIVGGYTSDLLSDVMGNVDKDMVWITLQTHRNVVAVAALKEVAAVVLVNGATLEVDAMKHAEEEGVTICTSSLPAFEVTGEIYNLLKK